MVKIILLFTSLFSFNPLRVDANFEEVDRVEVVETVGDFQLVEEAKLRLYHKDSVVFDVASESQTSMVLFQGSLYVSVLDQKRLTLHEFDLQGNKKRSVLHENFYKLAKLAVVEDQLYLYGEVGVLVDVAFTSKSKEYFQGSEAFVAKLNVSLGAEEVGLYGGSLNEGFVDLKFHQGILYAVCIKDALSGGDFGNTHQDKSVVLVALDLSLSVKNFVSLQDDTFCSLGTFEEFLFLMTETTLYQFDLDLNPVRGRIITSESIFSRFCSNYTLVVFERFEAKIYDLKTWDFTMVSLPEELDHVAVQNESFLLIGERAHRLSLLDLRNFEEESKPQAEAKVLHNFFGEVECEKVNYKNHYSPQVHGTYAAEYIYKTHVIEGSVVVEPECNVTSGLVYPVGYALEFTGTAYLNQTLIHYNHAIKQKGFHELVLYDNVGASSTYTFYVGDQLRFQEESKKDYDLIVYPNQEFSLNLEFSLPAGYETCYVWINNERYSVVVDEFKKASVVLKEFTSGPKTYRLTGVCFEKEGVVQEIKVEEEYQVYALQTDFEILGLLSNQGKLVVYDAEVQDPLLLLRGFRVRVFDQQSEQDFFYPISDQDIVLSYLSQRPYRITLLALFYEGADYFKEVELFSVDVVPKGSQLHLASIEVLQARDSLEKVRLSLPVKNIEAVYEKNELRFVPPESKLISTLIASVIVGLVGFGVVFFLRKKKKRT